MHVKQHQKRRDNTLRKHDRPCSTPQQSHQSLSTQSTEPSQLSSDSRSIRQQQRCSVIQPQHGLLLRHCRTPVLTNTADCAETWFALDCSLFTCFSHSVSCTRVQTHHSARTAPAPSTACPAFPPLFRSALTHNLGPGVSVCVQILHHRTHAHLLIN